MVLEASQSAHEVALSPGAGRPRGGPSAQIDLGSGGEVQGRARPRARAAAEDRLLALQEGERRRIARDLHDVVGGGLTAVKIALQRLYSAEGADSSRGAAIRESIEVVDAVLDEVRDVALDLRPSVLDDLGLIPALRWLVARTAKRAGLATHLEVDIPAVRLAADVETACFRLAQEALTNVMRHAAATGVRVSLRQCGEDLILEILDDGVGFDSLAREDAPPSLGLAGMRERAGVAGGRVRISSAPGTGTRVVARFPLLTAAVYGVAG